MRVVLQRVSQASVSVGGNIVAEIGAGILLFVGITHTDAREQADWLARKIVALRIFPALNGPSGFDRSLGDVGGGVLAVSQFTLYGDTKKGRRPDFTRAAKPDHAAPLFDYFVERLRAEGIPHVATGVFGADMQVEFVNDGPVTLILDADG